MRIEGNALIAFLIGDKQAERIVPATGLIPWLTVFVAGVMGFLAVFAMALALSSGRVSERWLNDLSSGATLRISAPAGQLDARTEAALQVLQTTPGIASARVLSDSEQVALLEPWLGTGLAVDTLPLPRLLDIQPDDPAFDAEGLRLRLAGEVPGAVLDDHSRWQEPLARAAGRIQWVGAMTLLMIVGAMGALVTLAATSALATGHQVILVLRLLGARDVYIARAFVRRFTLRAAFGATAGAALAASALALIQRADQGGVIFADFGFFGLEWFGPLAVPALAGAVAFWATRRAAFAQLRKLA